MTSYDRRSIALAVALSCVAGYVDSLGLLATGNFFVSFMSGNSTRLGLALGEGRFHYALVASGVIALFVSGVIVGTLVRYRAGKRRRSAVLLLVAGLLALAGLFHRLGWSDWGIGGMLLAMGAENAVFQGEGEVGIGLTYMTGALVKLGQRLAAIPYGGSPSAWLPYASLWLGLVCGATAGAVAYANLQLLALWAAVLVLLLLAGLCARDHSIIQSAE